MGSVPVSLRDEIEAVLRAWNSYETERGASPVIDYDCFPGEKEVKPADSRLAVLSELEALRRNAEESDRFTCQRIDADTAYLRALMGEHPPLDEYVFSTQGCRAAGWPEQYVTAIGDRARQEVESLGILWRSDTATELDKAEGPLDVDVVPDAIRHAASVLESAVRRATGSDAPYELSIETADVDAYWSYWLDGAGQRVRLRLNLRNARFTEVSARQFALHEVLGHGLQSASFAARCAHNDVPWVRLLAVHAPNQVLLEGLAQALPLFVAPDDTALVTRVRLDHYLQLVRAELHLAVNSGATVRECAEHAHARVPFWTDGDIADVLTDRGANPLLRSYLWAYPAGLDWFAALATADCTVLREVLHAAYRDPLTPADLAALWPDGPPVGGPGGAVRLRKPAVP
jgi:hypothetical protein